MRCLQYDEQGASPINSTSSHFGKLMAMSRIEATPNTFAHMV